MIIKPNVLTYDGETRAERPSPLHFWKNGNWEPDLFLLKKDANARLTGAFESAFAPGFTTSFGIKMDATIEALQRLKVAYDFAMLVGDAKMTIVDYSNAVHADLPLVDVAKILEEVGGNYRDKYLLKQTLRQQVMAAATPEAVAAIAWPATTVV